MSSLPRTAALIESGINERHIGAQLYVSVKGQLIADQAFGLARPANESRAAVEMTPDSINLWLSAGKPLTAVAIAQLWEKNRLDLDDPVARFIPEFAAQGKESITLRHLLTHTAPLRLADTGWPNATWEQMIQRICVTRPEPRWINGVTAGYSAHITWYLLAEIVQRLSQTPLPDYLRQHVFEPCGMNNTFIRMTPAEQADYAQRLAVMQVTDKGAPVDLGTETPQALSIPRPSGSARGPVRELGRFYETMLARGRGVISAQTVEAMTARHRVNTLDKTFNAILDWGLGFMINSSIYGNPLTPYQFGPHASARTFGHSGNQSSSAFADPVNGVVVAVVFNGLPGEAKHQERIRDVLRAVYEDLSLAPALG
jgi:CubicO group peptidase (beta-lactamase class C family)